MKCKPKSSQGQNVPKGTYSFKVPGIFYDAIRSFIEFPPSRNVLLIVILLLLEAV